MRSCLSFLVFVALLVGVIAWFGLPALAGGGVQLALTASGFRGDGTTIDVRADPPTNLLGGHADRVVVRSRGVTSGPLSAATVELTLDDVALFDRRAAAVAGALETVTLADSPGSTVAVERIDLSGPSDGADARLRIAPAEVRRRAFAALGALGLAISDVALEAPNVLAVTALGRTVRGTLVVDPAGALAVTLPGIVDVALVAPPAGLPIRFRSVAVGSDRTLVVDATIDLRALLGG
jgi:hypothetical protein